MTTISGIHPGQAHTPTVWHYDTASDLELSALDRLSRCPREPSLLLDSARLIVTVVVRTILRLWHRLQIVGRENLPSDGSFVLVANHASHLDAVCLQTALPLGRVHNVFPAAAKDYFFESITRAVVSVVVGNAIPFDRRRHARRSLDLCKRLLQGPRNTLVLFPEGTRTPTGDLGEFKPGIGLLLAGSDVPVVPCYLEGAFEAWPKGRRFPRPGRIRLRIGEPRSYGDLPPTKESALYIRGDLEAAVRSLAA